MRKQGGGGGGGERINVISTRREEQQWRHMTRNSAQSCDCVLFRHDYIHSCTSLQSASHITDLAYTEQRLLHQLVMMMISHKWRPYILTGAGTKALLWCSRDRKIATQIPGSLHLVPLFNPSCYVTVHRRRKFTDIWLIHWLVSGSRTRRFNTANTRDRHWTRSWASFIQLMFTQF